MNKILENMSNQCYIFIWSLGFIERRILAWLFFSSDPNRSPSSSDSDVDNLRNEVKVEKRRVTNDVGLLVVLKQLEIMSLIMLLNFVRISFLVYYFLALLWLQVSYRFVNPAVVKKKFEQIKCCHICCEKLKAVQELFSFIKDRCQRMMEKTSWNSHRIMWKEEE